MKLALALLIALLWQAGGYGASSVVSDGARAPAADLKHLRYQRSLTLPSDASGVACAVLDADVYAHAGSFSGSDLRVFRSTGSGRSNSSGPSDASGKIDEVPFEISYSAAQPTDAVTANVQNVSLKNGDIVFDLAMPQRPYTIVDLNLAAANFLATADVSGSDGKGGPAKPLGSYTLFDLTQEHLARSTSLDLQESDFAQLHVTLHLYSIGGAALPHLSAAIVKGATVPASREAQTLYTVVATTRKIAQQGASTVAQIDAPAHVPIERVSFVLDPAYKANFLRRVSITARRGGQSSDAPLEVIQGEIWRVTRTANAPGNLAIHAAKLTVGAVIASNVREAATVKVVVKNDGEPPLPIRAVQWEMRQRTICFDAAPGSTYTLRYGDKALGATVYDAGGLETIPAKPLLATLGPEEVNRDYAKQSDARTYEERNPELYWTVLLALIALVGAVASRHTKRRGRHR